MRTITDEDGRSWEAVAAESTGAHLKRGAALGFRPAGEDAEPIVTGITFNSLEAADFAIGTMSEKELRRRLAWAKTEAGIA
ncbi:MAG TPA: hypothetical protein VHG51_01075 [Longimicrobiaceae bacterium]|nr:hypothetical protein [Longimicrobiaceae bacterium]